MNEIARLFTIATAAVSFLACSVTTALVVLPPGTGFSNTSASNAIAASPRIGLPS